MRVSITLPPKYPLFSPASGLRSRPFQGSSATYKSTDSSQVVTLPHKVDCLSAALLLFRNGSTKQGVVQPNERTLQPPTALSSHHCAACSGSDRTAQLICFVWGVCLLCGVLV